MDRRIVLVALARLAAAASGASVYSAWAEPSVLRVAAAADMKFAMDEVIEAFREKYSTSSSLRMSTIPTDSFAKGRHWQIPSSSTE